MTHFEIVEPSVTVRLAPPAEGAHGAGVWVYRFRHRTEPWRMSIATLAEPGSKKLSLGGFRIAPQERTDDPAFDTDIEAIDLARGMEEKIYWSRQLHVGGPLARRDMSRIVGGKCVLQPTPDARVGQPRDRELLDWALECFARMEMESGVLLTTGQDLGHGIMSDGVTGSLDYLASRFHGCVNADTSLPTGEGNYYVLKGMLAAYDIEMADANVGLIGVGNIGFHILKRIREAGGTVVTVERNAERREAIESMGFRAYADDERGELFGESIDALVVNAAAHTLDTETVNACILNDTLRVVCGSENLAMPNPSDALRLLAAGQVYCPTELGGMMGYLTAVENYLAVEAGVPFRLEDVMEAARLLEPAAERATRAVRVSNYGVTFETAAASAL